MFGALLAVLAFCIRLGMRWQDRTHKLMEVVDRHVVERAALEQALAQLGWRVKLEWGDDHCLDAELHKIVPVVEATAAASEVQL